MPSRKTWFVYPVVALIGAGSEFTGKSLVTRQLSSPKVQ